MEIGGRSFYEPRLRWKSGRAYVRFYDPDKRPKQKDFALHTGDKATADHLFQQRRFAYLHGLLDPWAEKRKEGVTLDEAVDAYLKSQDVRASSLKCKRVRLTPFARRYPGMLVSGIDADAIEAYCFRKDLKLSTQQRYLSEMRQFVQFCRSEGWITTDPVYEVQQRIPKRKKRQRRELIEYLTPEEVRRIISAIEYDVEANPRREPRRMLVDIIVFAVATGLRRGEICNLRWTDVRLYEPPKRTRSGGLLYGWLSIRSDGERQTKTGDADRVPVVPQAHELLKKLRAEKGKNTYVFAGPRSDGRLNDWWISKLFREYRRLAKIRDEIHFHSLRHTCASWLAEAGVDLKVIQEVLRHANLKQTMRYAHLMPEVVANKMVGAFEQIQIE